MTEAVWGIDTIDARVPEVPRGAPVIWYYVTGTTQNPEIEWEPADAALFPHSQLYRIDQGFGNQRDRRRWFACDEFDLEAQAWTADTLVPAIRARNDIHWSTRIYASDGPWTELVIALDAAGVSTRSIFWREANWNLSEIQAKARLGGNRYAIQWASPSSNPDTLIPGTNLTLATAGADLNACRLGSTQWQG